METQRTPPLGFVSIECAATWLGLPKKFLREETRTSRLPCLVVGGRIMVNVGQVRESLLERAQKNPGQPDS